MRYTTACAISVAEGPDCKGDWDCAFSKPSIVCSGLGSVWPGATAFTLIEGARPLASVSVNPAMAKREATIYGFPTRRYPRNDGVVGMMFHVRLHGALWADQGVDMALPWGSALAVLFGGMVLVSLAVAWPIRRATSIAPSEALRSLE